MLNEAIPVLQIQHISIPEMCRTPQYCFQFKGTQYITLLLKMKSGVVAGDNFTPFELQVTININVMVTLKVTLELP